MSHTENTEVLTAAEASAESEEILLSEIATGLNRSLESAETATRAVLISKGYATICLETAATEITSEGTTALREVY